MPRFTLPLVALSELASINNVSFPSSNHYQVVTPHDGLVWPWRSYKTSYHTPPVLNVTHYGGDLAPGYIFFSPADHHGKYATHEASGTGLVMTSDGELIFAAEGNDYSSCTKVPSGMTNFRMQHYLGRPHITYWDGCNDPHAHWGHRWGSLTFLDEEYNHVTVSPDFHVDTLDDSTQGHIDMHDQRVTDDDTLVVTSYNSTQLDLRYMGGAIDTWVSDSMFFEFDVDTGETLFKWSSTETVFELMNETNYPLNPSRGSQRVPWDWFHINSVQKVGKDYMISARHQSTIFMISGEDGHVIWKLHGITGGDFGEMPQRFRWQHHATAQNVTANGMVVSLFNNNNGGGETEASQSTALSYYLSLPPNPDHPPRVVQHLKGTENNYAWAGTQGSYQMAIGNGNDFVGYGKTPLMREYDSQGYLLWQAWFGEATTVMSYRAFKDQWSGTPKNWDPIALFEPLSRYPDQANIYVSWNGATDISHWAIFAGANREDLVPIGVVEKKGFETGFQPPADTGVDIQCVQLGAVRDGIIIRGSNVACRTDAPAPPSKAHIPFDPLHSGLDITYPSLFQAGLVLAVMLAAFCVYKSCCRRKRFPSSSGSLMAKAADATLPRFSHARGPSWFSSHSRASSLFSHARVPSGLSLRAFTPPATKYKLSPMVGAEDEGVFEEVKVSGAEASSQRGRRSTLLGAGGAEEFDDMKEDAGSHDDDDDDGYDSSREDSNARTPFIRRGTDWEK
ncbi:ASST-domain-containing protein [Neohortaea acidophila]|uniref:ASST-domain-containing protein n=1 Tax=Neohortaea acidophila TaxID=245834 RepID=A0A6A6PY18_9PEZI|nr:ASST-domain-containing protein [Neohortaea acidophila]KAF2485078.1 ASST-domain-containing protein [Neohortaea acidophila]